MEKNCFAIIDEIWSLTLLADCNQILQVYIIWLCGALGNNSNVHLLAGIPTYY